MWQKRRWRYLLSRIDHLPRNSAYVEAVSQDEELARQLAGEPEPEKKSSAVSMRDWSPELEGLYAVADRLGDVIQAVIAAAGAKPPQVPAMPRPRTALDKLRNDPRREHHKVLSKVLIQQPDGSYRRADEPDGPLIPGIVPELLEPLV